MTTAPRDGLVRSTPFELIRADETRDGLTLEGYAAVFDSPTRIDSWEGRFDETIAPGAFAKTIRETTPVLQFDHGQHPLIGSIPIGTVKRLKEDDRGLYVEARMSDNWLIQPVRDAIEGGGITGMSFRFSVVREEWDETRSDAPLRTLKELRVAELGPVVWPAYEATSVSVRSRQIAAELEADPNLRADFARAVLLEDTQTTDADRAALEHPDDDGSSTDAPLDEHPSTPLHDRIRAERDRLRDALNAKEFRRG